MPNQVLCLVLKKKFYTKNLILGIFYTKKCKKMISLTINLLLEKIYAKKSTFTCVDISPEIL
jgi:hypothetical protein